MKLFSILSFLFFSLNFFCQTGKINQQEQSTSFDAEDFDVVFIFYHVQSAGFPSGSFTSCSDKVMYKTQLENWLRTNQSSYLAMVNSTNADVFVFRRSDYYRFDVQKQAAFKEWFNQLDELLGLENKTGLIKPKRMVLSAEDFQTVKNYFNNEK